MAGQDLSEVDSGNVAPTGSPDQLMSKPRWRRVLISFAGPAVNLLMPVVLLTGFFVIRGFPYPAYLDNPVVISGLPKNSPLAGAGVSDGDHLVAINDAATPNWSKVSTILQQIVLTLDQFGVAASLIATRWKYDSPANPARGLAAAHR